MHPFLSLGGRIVLDSWWVMITLGVLGGSTVSLLALKKEIGLARAWTVVSLMVPAAFFGAHFAHWILQTLPNGVAMVASVEPRRASREGRKAAGCERSSRAGRGGARRVLEGV